MQSVYSVASAKLAEMVYRHIQETSWGFYPSVEMQSVYSTALAEWTVPVMVPSMSQINLFWKLFVLERNAWYYIYKHRKLFGDQWIQMFLIQQ